MKKYSLKEWIASVIAFAIVAGISGAIILGIIKFIKFAWYL